MPDATIICSRSPARGCPPPARKRALRWRWIDISTGEFRVAECDRVSLSAEIARLEPGEIIVSDALYSEADLAPYWRSLPAVTPVAARCLRRRDRRAAAHILLCGCDQRSVRRAQPAGDLRPPRPA